MRCDKPTALALDQHEKDHRSFKENGFSRCFNAARGRRFLRSRIPAPRKLNLFRRARTHAIRRKARIQRIADIGISVVFCREPDQRREGYESQAGDRFNDLKRPPG